MNVARILGAGLAALALSWLAPAQADTVVGVHTWSVHEPRAADASNDNPGLYVRHGAWQVGAYRNSHRRASVYAARVWSVGPVDIATGVVTGYERRREAATCESVAEFIQLSREAARMVDRTQSMRCWRETGSASSPVIPLLSASVALPAVGPVTPRLTYVPRVAGMGAHVIHLSLEAPL